LSIDPSAVLMAATIHERWLWGAVITLALLLLTAKFLNWLASIFERCPRCDSAVRVGQRLCHHCFKPVNDPKSASRPAARPLGSMPEPRR